MKVNDSVAILDAANPVESAVDAYDLQAPRANGVMHLDWVFPEDFWLENIASDFKTVVYPQLSSLLTGDAVTRRATVAGTVAAYDKHNKGQLKPGVPTTDGQTGRPGQGRQGVGVPRSWSNVIAVLSQLEAHDKEAALLALKGLVGTTPLRSWNGSIG